MTYCKESRVAYPFVARDIHSQRQYRGGSDWDWKKLVGKMLDESLKCWKNSGRLLKNGKENSG